MGTVIQNNETGSEAEQQAQEQALAENILNNFELPESLTAKIDETVKKEEVGDAEEVVEEEKPEAEATEEKEEKPEVVEEKGEEEDEELIPKSKMQKILQERIGEQVRERKILEARIRNLEEKQQSSNVKDSDMQRLEEMSEGELESLKEQTRLAQFNNSTNMEMLPKLLQLEKKIDLALRTSNTRLDQKQNSYLREAVESHASVIPEFQKVHKDVFAIADDIYATNPSLKKLVDGKALAFNLAAKHFMSLRDVNATKSRSAELGRQVNTLKKKVSLDSVSRKASNEPDSETKLFKRAKNGTLGDKMEFFRKRLGTDEQVESFVQAR